jgi:hypothetical protein
VTTYSEVTADDKDVAIYLATRIDVVNIWRLPLKAWVARQDGKIVAVMIFDNVTYPAIHILVPDPNSRPFMRIVKLWLIAYKYFKSIKMPIICAPVPTHLHHFKSLVRRLGFREVGEERDDNNVVVEIIYGYHFNEEQNENSVHPAE